MDDFSASVPETGRPQLPAWATGRSEREETGGSGFLDALKEAVSTVNQRKIEAGEAVTRFYSGEIDDIHTVALAMKKSEISFRYLLAVRQKLMDAYQELTRLNV